MEIRIADTLSNTELYLDFISKVYGNSPSFPMFKHDVLQAIDYTRRNEAIACTLFQAFDNDEFLGQIALIENKQLPESTAFFGFFECVEDETVFLKLWGELKKQAAQRGISNMSGPINASTWFSNRVITKRYTQPYFVSEVMSQDFYADFLQSAHPHNIVEYHSAYRRKVERIIELTEPAYTAIQNTPFRVERINSISTELMQDVFRISEEVFASNPGYVPINYSDFTQLYNAEKVNEKSSRIYVMYNGYELIGYSINIVAGTSLIMKTICLLPQYQDKGLGNAFVYYVHKEAQEHAFEQVIYALVRKENKVKRFPTDDVEVMREYALYEFEL